MRVYVAGPYTGGDTIVNVKKAIEAGDKVVQAGFNAFVPHLFHFWHFLLPGDYKQWMRMDKDWLLDCDVLLRLPGPSAGADEEVELARRVGIPVFFGFSTEFWDHLKSGGRKGTHIDQIFEHVEAAIESLKAHVGATMSYNDDGYVVSWRKT